MSHENGPAMNLVPFVYKQSHMVHKSQRRKGRVYTTEKKNLSRYTFSLYFHYFLNVDLDLDLDTIKSQPVQIIMIEYLRQTSCDLFVNKWDQIHSQTIFMRHHHYRDVILI